MNNHSLCRLSPLALILCLLGILCWAPPAFANHPVLVEGEADFDGDGRLGNDEDLDGDRIFGTLNTALAADLGAVNQNGGVLVVTSGRFPETLVITGSNGNVTIAAAPGVEASIDAVLGGAPGNVERQVRPGIVVDAGANRNIILRNLTIRNWLQGIVVQGDSRVIIDGCRVEQNLNHGILVRGNASVVITDSRVLGTGFRVGAAGNAPDPDTPMPGNGIELQDDAVGAVVRTTVAGNFGDGVRNDADEKLNAKEVTLFDNNRNKEGKLKKLKDFF